MVAVFLFRVFSRATEGAPKGASVEPCVMLVLVVITLCDYCFLGYIASISSYTKEA